MSEVQGAPDRVAQDVALPYVRRRLPVHVPPGFHPGAQTRRSRSVPRTAMRALALGTVVFYAGLGAIEAMGYVAEFEVPGPLLVALATAALLCCIGSFVERTSWAWNLSTLDVDVSMAHREVSRGDEISVTVDPGGHDIGAGRVEVGLVCVEYSDVRVTLRRRISSEPWPKTRWVTREHECHAQWQPFTDRSIPVHFRVPQQGCFSYEGRHLSVAWSVMVRGRESTLQPRRVPIWVRP